MRLSPPEIMKRAKELALRREEAERRLIQHPSLEMHELAQSLGVSYNTVRTWKSRLSKSTFTTCLLCSKEVKLQLLASHLKEDHQLPVPHPFSGENRRCSLCGLLHSTVPAWLNCYLYHHPKVKVRIAPETSAPVVSIKKYTFEEVLKAFPDTSSLGLFLLEGFLAKVDSPEPKLTELKDALAKEKDKSKQLIQELEEQTKEKLKWQKEYSTLYNEVLATKRLSHLTIDQVRHRIIKKE